MQAQPYDILLEKHWDTQELNRLVVLQWNGAETLKKQLGHLNGRYTVQIIADQITIN